MSISHHIRPAAFAALLACLPAFVAAQEPPKKEISETLSSELGKLRTLTDSKDFAGAVKLLDGLITQSADPSYDLALLAQIKAQIILNDGKFAEAIPLLEKALDLGARFSFFDDKTLLDTRYLLSQISYQLGTETKDAAVQQALFEKAYQNIKTWLELTPKPTVEAYLYAASILYNQGTANASQPDLAKVRLAQAQAEKGLYVQIKPRDQLYVLILASLQQQGDNVRAAEILEILVKQQPTSSQYWQQLAAAYYGLAADSKKDEDSERYNLRALLTLERAQARGLLNSPKENFSVVALCFTLRQYDRAIELLEKGLAGGGLESTRRNWDLLASAYQQMHQADKSVTTYERAIQAWPQDGQLEFSLAQLYYSQSKVENAYSRMEKAVAKEGLDKPGQAHQFLAYLAYELQRYKETITWAEAAGKYPDAKQADLEKLIRAAKDAIQERTAATTT
jgi:hypothetical protein